MLLKRLIFKLSVLSLILVGLRAVAAPAPAVCRDVAVLCMTDTSYGSCGYEYGQECNLCYGADGSVALDPADCGF